MKYLFVLSIFISSFLLFLVQPMLAKALLPFVGGVPAVWIASMLFFQCVLLLGYGYAAFGSAYLTARKQLIIHICLFAIVIVVALPVQLHMPLDFNQTQPELWVLVTLLLSIGFPYFVLTSNSSLLQRWYHHSYNHSPYFLFSISNIGSMLGLLGYPLIIEWSLPLPDQMTFFSAGFITLALVIMALSRMVCQKEGKVSSEGLGKNLSLKKASSVVFLGFIPSSLFLSVTLYVTTDIASFPMLWVIPLALYLLTFIIAFSTKSEKWTSIAQKLHPIALIVIVIASLLIGSSWLIIPHFLGFFIIAMSCHGQVARNKPGEQYLTAYYFWLSVGGALGGLFNTISPYLFNDVYEYYIVVLISLFALPSKHLAGGKKIDLPETKKLIPILCVLAASIAYIWTVDDGSENIDDNTLFQERNFFGVSKVYKNEHMIIYKHGTTTHTIQPMEESKKLEPSAYYVPILGLVKQLPNSFYDKPFAVLGLGGGTLACLGRKGQAFDMFEIDPVVIKVAYDSSLFTYMRDCQPETRVIQGDGRLKLAEEPDQKYNLLIMDAFSSDSVPMHLLTKEAVGMYMSKLVPKSGLLMFNISNRHLDLRNVLARQAHEYGWTPYYYFYVESEELDYDYSAQWMVMLPPDSPWEKQVTDMGAKRYEPAGGVMNTPLWTDDYSNIFPIIK